MIDRGQANELGFDNPAKYMRAMFQQLRKLAPRARAPRIFGGRKLLPGATESKKELAVRLRPIVKELLEENKGAVLSELRHLFELTIGDELKVILVA